MNGKKVLLLFVITSMILSLMPSMMFANAVTAPTLSASSGTKGTTIKVTGSAGTVPAGTTLELYWDTTTGAWNGVKGLLNSTTAKASGAYEVWFKVPEAKHGTHYVWIKTAAGESASASFTVNTKVSLSSSSGLAGDSITLSLYGLAGTKDVQAFFIDPATEDWSAGWTSSTSANVPKTIGTGDGSKTTFSGTLTDTPIVPGSVVVTVTGFTFADDGDGTLSATPDTADGTINYISGAIEIDFDVALGDGVTVRVTAYDYIETVSTIKVLGTTTTSSVGSASITAKVPSGWDDGDYTFAVYDGAGNEGEKAFTIGPVITVSPAAATVGSVITITGRGFADGDTIDQGGVYLEYGSDTFEGMITTDVPIDIDSTGRIRLNFVVPQVDEVSDEYSITVETGDGAVASTDFEVTALAKVSVTPGYGPVASTITVSGVNYPKIKDVTVYVELWDEDDNWVADIGTVKTLADGTFSKAFKVPAAAEGGYQIAAGNDDYFLGDSAGFKVGSMNILLSDDSGPTGMWVYLSGNGFTHDGTWNATFGSKTIIDNYAVSDSGLLEDGDFWVPQLPVGTYTITVWDVDAEISLTTTFTITKTTSVTLSVPSAPNGYNVTLRGYGFSDDYDGVAVDFILYNATSTGVIDWWDTITVVDLPDGVGACATNDTGEFYGYWIIEDSDIVSKGAYLLNVTDASGDYAVTIPFTIGDVHAVCTPRKSTSKIGETINFVIEHSFGNDKEGVIYGSKVNVYDPSGTLVFSGDPLNTWVKTGLWYTAPYSSQTAGLNPMVLLDDAATGTWSYKWVDTDGDTVKSGTFTVAASDVSVTNEKIDALTEEVAAITSSLSGITSAVQGAQTSATTAGTKADAATAAATEASAAATAAGAKADAATAAANAAKASADAAKVAADGLTTMVYVAIAASVVAALAAIYAVMQITKKIA